MSKSSRWTSQSLGSCHILEEEKTHFESFDILREEMTHIGSFNIFREVREARHREEMVSPRDMSSGWRNYLLLMHVIATICPHVALVKPRECPVLRQRHPFSGRIRSSAVLAAIHIEFVARDNISCNGDSPILGLILPDTRCGRFPIRRRSESN